MRKPLASRSSLSNDIWADLATDAFLFGLSGEADARTARDWVGAVARRGEDFVVKSLEQTLGVNAPTSTLDGMPHTVSNFLHVGVGDGDTTERTFTSASTAAQPTTSNMTTVIP